MKDRQSIFDEIAQEEALLAKLDREREDALNRVEALRAKLGTFPGKDLSAKTPAGKVALFRRLFRGREDVFPKFWVNTKTGKKGYSPACTNEWVHGLCGKIATSRVKCGDCNHQAFLPVSEQTILDHLQGKLVAGVYPLLPDDTCWFLAVDFDKQTWAEDVSSFVETCRSVGLFAAVERSRSGNGAHVWFFFEEPVSASIARNMGCYLITGTMSRRHQLSMESYDRIFPNQDTMPKGGFGNLIALPLQFEARKSGNTVLLDDNLAPFSDQWGYLASIKPITANAVREIAEEAVRRDLVTGVRPGVTDEEEDAVPWNRMPSRKSMRKAIPGPFPKEVRAVIAQHIFVEKVGLPSALINAIKRVAAFQNPEFYKKQKMRLSTVLTPRIISCFEDHAEHVAIPRGCLEDLSSLLNEYKIQLVLDDKRTDGTYTETDFNGQLTKLQEGAVGKMLEHDIGVVVAPPGTGKTVVGTYLIAARARNTLVLVHRKPLLDQWVAQISLFLGIAPKAIGQIGATKRKITGRIDVAMIQSLVRKGEVADFVADYGHVVVDECHHLSAVSFEQVLSEVKARYVTGLTATPYRRDGHQPIIHMQCGPVRYKAASKDNDRYHFARRLICRGTDFNIKNMEADPQIQQLYAAIASDKERNGLIVEDVVRSLEEGRSPLVLTERKDHLDILADELRDKVRHLLVLKGGLTAKKRREAIDQLKAIPEDEARLVLATGRYIGEGFDDARLDTLFIAMPFSWRGTLVQYAGRLHRIHPGKKEVRVYDYVDRNVPMLLRMHEKRLKGFRAIGYTMDAG